MYIRFLAFLLITFTTIGNAQNTVSGIVIDENNNPLPFITVRTKDNLKWTTTNNKGYFEIKNISKKNVTLVFNRLGLQETEIKVSFNVATLKKLNVRLLEDNLGLDEIIVTASLKNKRTTSTIIKQQAIQHLQASSLSDVLQLVPGQLIQNQNFDNVKQALIRQKDTRDGAEDATSFGTNIRINGISVSNNANLQNASSALRGNVNFFNSTAGRGTDLRNISTTNIQKVEVVKGIPSASYGDITSGVILIETKKGKSPLEVTQRITPKVYQTSINKGFSLRENSTLNVDIDYTKAIQNEREKDLNYNRLHGNLAFVLPLFDNKVKTTTLFSVATIFDGNSNNNQTTQRKSKQNGFNIGFTGEWFTEKKWAEKVTFDVATSYQKQESFDKNIVNKPLSLLSLFTTTNEGPGIFLPQTYISEVTVNGKPFSFYTKLTNEFEKKIGNSFHKFLVGLEYNFEKNYGNGVSFNPQRPPEGLGFQTLRERPYKEVPALNHVSFFAEDNINFNLFSMKNKLAVGVRVDNFQPESFVKSRYGLQVAPRINFSSKITDDFIIKGGWGIASKSPSLLFLYPDNAFFDLVSLNYFTGNINENLVILSTHVFNTENNNLKVAKSNKFEVGFNYSFKSHNIDIVAYQEETKNAFGYSQQAIFMPYNVYQVTQQNANQLPKYSLLASRKFIGTYNTPNNHFNIKNKGIEMITDLKIAQPLSVQVSGAFIKTNATYSNDNYEIVTNATSGEQIVGAYQNGGTNSNQQFNTTIRSALHIPRLKFVISMTAQTIWHELQKQRNYTDLPYKYATADGNFIAFDTKNKDLVNEFKRNANSFVKNNKPIWLINTNISKEIGDIGKISFFINNMFNSRPVVNKRLRNIPFFYGFEATLKI